MDAFQCIFFNYFVIFFNFVFQSLDFANLVWEENDNESVPAKAKFYLVQD